MTATREGGKKAAQTNKLKHGADFYVRIGKLGGKAGTGHKFAHGKADPSAMGKIGGKIGRRGPAKFVVVDDAPFEEGFNAHKRSFWKRLRIYR